MAYLPTGITGNRRFYGRSPTSDGISCFGSLPHWFDPMYHGVGRGHRGAPRSRRDDRCRSTTAIYADHGASTRDSCAGDDLRIGYLRRFHNSDIDQYPWDIRCRRDDLRRLSARTTRRSGPSAGNRRGIEHDRWRVLGNCSLHRGSDAGAGRL